MLCLGIAKGRKKNMRMGDEEDEQDHTRYYKDELQYLEDTGRGGTEGAQLLRNHIRNLELHVQEEERSKRELEELNNAKSIEEILLQIITE
jgi:hypothetical protein